MIHEIIHRNQNQDITGFYYPRYSKDCISNIPGTILDLFGVNHDLSKLPFDLNTEVEGVNKVVLFVLDGFGYNQFLRYHNEQKFLASLAKKSEVFPLTSIFPSQTTNALTTLNTGLTPQEHGLFEYYIYIKEVDRIVNTLRFEPLGSRVRNELLENGFSPDILFHGHTIQSKLKEAGIKSFTHIYASYAYSHYSRLLFEDSTFIPSLKSSDLIVTLKKKLEEETGPAYFFVHLSNLDTISHEYGPKSYEYGAELSAISYLMNKELIEKIDPKTAKETLILLTADHGGVNIVPKDTTYLNGFPDIMNNLQKGSSGNTILPTGSARDVFLHVQPEKLVETQDLLRKKIGDKAKVVETKDAINNGLFGRGNVGSQFIDRAGNLLILPYGNETVWFEHFKDIKYNPIGQHGGLNAEEMVVPLAVTRLDKLKV
ncbi:MAG: alkaline phosphatase family protein [Candidatus Bathyarchaeota archaeon]|nr:alkaline phosphatase family protein [Candidatus Bathyarchaeum tardum]WGM89178.1 MAG: alkaline phosphatase family protein [Candidatus Bathyarchaeum tardum]WNZ28582.1 MAG: alkaline phosphatase family protein [Candidatus Bathyarchaeota archaeon]